MSIQLLQRFSSSLLSTGHSFTPDASTNLRVFRRKVELSFSVLKALGENGNSASTGRNVSLVSRKRGKAATNNRRIDPLPFGSMGIAVPTTDAEACDVCVNVLSQLQNILEVCEFTVDSLSGHGTEKSQHYLLVLREPPLSEIFKSLYTETELPLEGAPSLAPGPDQSNNPAFPMVQSMKATLSFDDIEEFGEWPILLSTRAQKDLRDFGRANGAVFQSVMEKIKWVLTLHRDECC